MHMAVLLLPFHFVFVAVVGSQTIRHHKTQKYQQTFLLLIHSPMPLIVRQNHFFDYFLTDLPQKILLSGKCTNCKHRLSGEEILAGFQNLKIVQVQMQNIYPSNPHPLLFNFSHPLLPHRKRAVCSENKEK